MMRFQQSWHDEYDTFQHLSFLQCYPVIHTRIYRYCLFVPRALEEKEERTTAACAFPLEDSAWDRNALLNPDMRRNALQQGKNCVM